MRTSLEGKPQETTALETIVVIILTLKRTFSVLDFTAEKNPVQVVSERHDTQREQS